MATATATVEASLVESVYWTIAMASGNRSVRLRGLSPAMLTDEGEIINSGSDEDPTNVVYDENFVYYVLTERFLKPLGLVSPDGSVKEKYITGTLVPAAIEYAKKESEREAVQRRLEIATQMTKLNGRTVEENVKLLEAKEEVEI